MKHSVLYLLIALWLGGCSTTTPPTHEYTVLSPEISSSHTPPQSGKVLSVASSKALSSLMGKNIIYLRENGESGAYLYSRWSDTPSVLIQRTLIQSLHDSALFASVIPASSLAQGEWILESELDGFYHRFENKQSTGYIDITYRIVERPTKKIIASKRFVITAPAPSNDASGGIIALTNATRELNSQCVAWLRSALKEIK